MSGLRHRQTGHTRRWTRTIRAGQARGPTRTDPAQGQGMSFDSDRPEADDGLGRQWTRTVDTDGDGLGRTRPTLRGQGMSSSGRKKPQKRNDVNQQLTKARMPTSGFMKATLSAWAPPPPPAPPRRPASISVRPGRALTRMAGATNGPCVTRRIRHGRRPRHGRPDSVECRGRVGRLPLDYFMLRWWLKVTAAT